MAVRVDVRKYCPAHSKLALLFNAGVVKSACGSYENSAGIGAVRLYNTGTGYRKGGAETHTYRLRRRGGGIKRRRRKNTVGNFSYKNCAITGIG